MTERCSVSLSPPRPPPSQPSSGPQSPVDNHGDESASTDNDEAALGLLMLNFRKHGGFGLAGHGGDSESCSDAESSGDDDVAYLRQLQEQFLPPSAARDASGNDDTPSIIKPIRSFPPSDTDDEEDIETLRAIERRFACYCREVTLKDFSPETSSTVSAVTSEEDPNNLPWTLVINEEHQEQSSVGLPEAGDETSRLSVYPKFGMKFLDTPSAVPPDTFSRNRARNEDYPEHSHIDFNEENTSCNLSARHVISPKFPKSVQNFIEALKKNRSCQRFIRNKLVEIEAKREVNRKLKERIKCLMDFHHAYRRKLGNNLCHKRDPRIRLISLRNQISSRKVKQDSKDSSALHFSPDENPELSNYEMVMRRFPVSLRERQWSHKEKSELLKGVNQQYQEILILKSIKHASGSDGSIDSVIMSTIDCVNHQATPEILRSLLPLVNWDKLASSYLPRRSGPSCESRWLNHEDPMINHNSWTLLEDKKLLFTVQERGLYNWIDIAVTLGTDRTPFQCLVRYQRSLNPHILNREWTSDEDAKLHDAVETFGDNNWQIVASHLDGRTSNQCSVRWRNTLLPERKRVGRWSVEEDKRLKVSVTLFGAKDWKKIAHFVPGRTQSQCRERWLNCLDPSLNLERWTDVEDSKLLAAIAEHGHSWSKVAASIPGRTDNHCRRRWKVLLPHEVPMLKAVQQLKKTVLISNFVGRESERPALGPSDFTPIIRLAAPNTENCIKSGKIMSRKQPNPAKKMKASSPNKLKKARKRFKRSTEENSTENSVMADASGNLSLLCSENA
ncbi:hypothetical protein KSP39_PZI015971 [Platanthera zijinensis]|uniref:Uncharacterized protein n=1 Tax=Platanthera zijinensis TaxID=2320716 RepID=A0AAP0B831_9ASPA